MDTQEVKILLESLEQANLVYRFAPERFQALLGRGYPYPSPTREVQTPSGPMIEEVIQPVLEPVVLNHGQRSQLEQIASAWPKFLKAQLEIFRLAKSGQFEPEIIALIQNMCTAEEWEKGLIDPGYEIIHPFIRLDAVPTEDGFKIMDINSSRPAGAGDMINFQRGAAMLNQPDFSFPNLAGHFSKIVFNCLDQWSAEQNLPGESTPLKVVVRQTDGDWHNFQTLYCQLVAAGLNVQLVEPGQLNGEQGAILRSRIKEGDPAFTILKTGYPQNRCVISPLFRRFLGNKVWMYAFRRPELKPIFLEHLGDDYEVLNRAFPPIGLVENSQVGFPDNSGKLKLSELQKEQWVIKDPASSSARRMYLGLSMGKKRWAEAMQQISRGSIVQRVYKVTETRPVAGSDGEVKPLKLFPKYGIYIFGKKLAGVEYHARTSPVVHGARDAYFNAVCFN
jgi:hypothetical protein